MLNTISRLALTAALLSAPALAFAQQTTPAGNGAGANTNSDEVVVTGLKHKETLGELTQPATVVTKTEIQAQAFTDLTEVLRQTPGIQFQQAGAPGQFIYPRLRGFTDSTLYTFDGMTLNGGGSGGINYSIGQIDPTMMDRVEVLRGPHATLYGANTTSGIIALTSKSGTQYESDISVEGGSEDWKKVFGGTQNRLDLGGGTLSYSLNGSYVDSGGVWQYEGYKNATFVGRTTYDYGPIEVGASGYASNNVFHNAYLVEAISGQTPQTYAAFQIPDPSEGDYGQLSIATVWLQDKINDHFSQKLMLGFAEQDFKTDQHDYANGGYIGSYVAPYDGWTDPNTYATYSAGTVVPVYPYNYVYTTAEQNREADYNLHYDGGPVSAVVGATYLWQRYIEGGSFGAANEKQNDASGYGDIGLNLIGNRLHLEGGARIDSYSAWGTQPTYSVGANFEVVSGLKAYVNYGRSFTAPTLDQLYNPQYGSTTLTPEKARTWEGGFRIDLLDHGLTGSVTYWNSYVNNVITYDYSIPNPRVNPPFGQYANENAEQSNGVEVEAAYRLTSWLTLNGNYTYTDASTEAGGIWSPMIENARNMGNIGLTYTAQKFTATVNAYITGPRLRWAGDVSAPGYHRIDLSGRYHLTDRIDLYTRLQDITNEKIIETLGYKNQRFYGIVGASARF